MCLSRVLLAKTRGGYLCPYSAYGGAVTGTMRSIAMLGNGVRSVTYTPGTAIGSRAPSVLAGGTSRIKTYMSMLKKD